MGLRKVDDVTNATGQLSSKCGTPPTYYLLTFSIGDQMKRIKTTSPDIVYKHIFRYHEKKFQCDIKRETRRRSQENGIGDVINLALYFRFIASGGQILYSMELGLCEATIQPVGHCTWLFDN